MRQTAKRNQVTGEVHVCAHRVSFWYEIGGFPLTPELQQALTDEAESRAKTCIADGYLSGELNCLYTFARDRQEELRGWWEIEKD